jgi:hypothetical protein
MENEINREGVKMESDKMEKTEIIQKERTIIKLNKMTGEYVFKNTTVSKNTGEYGEYFMLFHGLSDDKITFVNENTVLGAEILKIYEKIKNAIFEMSVKSFDSGNYQGWNIQKVIKIKNNDFENNDKEPTLEGF